jgi:predicted glycosyltransferase
MGHPAHFHLFKNMISDLEKSGAEVKVLIKTKDVLEDLIRNSGFDYTNINAQERGKSKSAILLSLLKREFSFFKIARKFKPDLMIGTSAEISHVGKILGIPSIVVNEDDVAVVPYFAKVAYPFATNILAPECTDVGQWSYKKVGYKGYHELAYLHPDHFTARYDIVNGLTAGKRFFLIRFAKLEAHHDEGRSGISNELATELTTLLSRYGKVFISSERSLPPELEKYRLDADPSLIHHFLAYADLYIGDSQTMAAEAAVLGTPSIRFNDFIGQISYLEELEHDHGLTFGIKTGQPEKMLAKAKEICSNRSIKEEFVRRRDAMLNEKFNTARFFSWLVSGYPQSVTLISSDSNYYEYQVLKRTENIIIGNESH